ncbi:BTB domain-containing protein [Fusarium sp. Ph1]|nr:BTB domain-containing protein [Fusarium sp. Ph1]
MPPKKRITSIKRKQPEPETPTEENEAPFLREIIPDGDVILVVGPEKSKIQVSSHLLRTTSPVFNVMLGPNFKEGTALRENEGPTEILEPDEIYEISILAQKYDLVDRLALACEAWFGHTGAITYGSTKQDWKMLLAAYWLRSELGFKNVSKMLLHEGNWEPLYRNGMETSDQVLGLRLCLAIQELRSNEIDEMGLCLGCFYNPKTRQFTRKNRFCSSKYTEDVLP